MVNITSLITIAIVIVVVYFFVKFIVSPLLQILCGIIIFVIAVYILQHFFSINFYDLLGPAAKYIDVQSWISNIKWLFSRVMQYINQIISFFHYLLSNIPHYGK